MVLLLFLLELGEMVWEVFRGQRVLVGCQMEEGARKWGEGEEQKAEEEEQTKGSVVVFEVKRRLEGELLLVVGSSMGKEEPMMG